MEHLIMLTSTFEERVVAFYKKHEAIFPCADDTDKSIIFEYRNRVDVKTEAKTYHIDIYAPGFNVMLSDPDPDKLLEKAFRIFRSYGPKPTRIRIVKDSETETVSDSDEATI